MKVTDGIELLKRRYLRNDPEMQKLVDEEFQKLEIGQQIDDLKELAQDLAPAVEMKLQWLRRALDEGEKDSAEGRTISLEQLNQHLDSIRQEIVERQK